MAGKFIPIPPYAAAMTEALRGLGYSLEAAIADTVDNSICAKARNISIQFDFPKDINESAVIISDDGGGMSEEELIHAMSIGRINPLEKRSQEDLGRFGLGLKTAAFSQGRLLTVITKKENSKHAMYWDLDKLTSNQWLVGIGIPINAQKYESLLDSYETGTVVIWQKLDRFFSECSELNINHIVETVRRTSDHLGMVFHRFLQDKDFSLSVNGKAINPWDPYLMNHPGKLQQEKEHCIPSLLNKKAIVQVNVLPLRERLTDDEFQKASGVNGWTQHQGFFVYRNKRLLVPGSWLGLGKGRSWYKDEAHRLVRIRLDIGNDKDNEWQIDIRKSFVKPPHGIRQTLQALAEASRKVAEQALLGKKSRLIKSHNITEPEDLPDIWQCYNYQGHSSWRIWKDHPAIKLLKDCGDIALVNSVLRLIEESAPVQKIYLESAKTQELPNNNFALENNQGILSVMQTIYDGLKRKYGEEQSIRMLKNMNPFNSFPELIEKIRK